MSFYFEWDATKAAANRRKHGVTFSEAATAFPDSLARITPDPDHSAGRSRAPSWDLRIEQTPGGNIRPARQSDTNYLRASRNAKSYVPTRKTSSRKTRSDVEMRPEYDFTDAGPNRFARHFAKTGGGVLVLLEPDVAEVFDSSKKVNKFLRATLSAVKK